MKPPTIQTTALIVGILFIAAGLYDFYAVTVGDVDVSISQFLQYSAFKAPLTVFTFGYICGHLFFYIKSTPNPIPPRMTNVALWTTIAVITIGICDLCGLWLGLPHLSMLLQFGIFKIPMIMFIFGCIAGRYFGYMKPKA